MEAEPAVADHPQGWPERLEEPEGPAEMPYEVCFLECYLHANQHCKGQSLQIELSLVIKFL